MATKNPDPVLKLEKKIHAIYTQAHKDLKKKSKQYLASIKGKWDKAEQDYKSGKITKAEKNAIQAELLKSNPWEETKNHVADILTKTNELAVAMINHDTRGYFTYSANHESYNIEHGAGVSFGFGLYDQKTISRLLMDNPELLPQKTLDPKKDVPWNMKKINNAVTQGIIQGESLFMIADRIANVTGETNERAMIRTARTAMTGAQNGGRILAMREAESIGIKIQKKWMATLDTHTRDTHRHLDGQSVPLDEKFTVNGKEIDFPGDPSAPPELVYNCRCTLIDDFVDFPSTYNRYDNIDRVPIEGMTYEEWEKAKASGKDMAPKSPTWSISPAFSIPQNGQNQNTQQNQSTPQQTNQQSGQQNGQQTNMPPIPTPAPDPNQYIVPPPEEWLEKVKANTERDMLEKEKAWLPLIGQDGIDGIRTYSTDSFTRMNAYLRALAIGKTEQEAIAESRIREKELRATKDAIAGLNNVTLKETLFVRRGTDMGDIVGAFMTGNFGENFLKLQNMSADEINQTLQGAIGKIGAFTSTSSIYSRGFGGDLEIIFCCPPGTHCSSIMGISVYGTGEGETLLNALQTVKFVKCEESDGHMGSWLRVYLEIIP